MTSCLSLFVSVCVVCPVPLDAIASLRVLSRLVCVRA